MKKLVLPALIALFAAACGNDHAEVAQHGPGETCSADGIVVSDAWIRAARAGQPTSAAYFSLCNGGQTEDALVSFTFSGAQAAELHTTTLNEESLVTMTPTDEIALGAGQMATLEPEGQHVMLIGLEAPLVAGETTTATLIFRNAPDITIVFDIRDGTSNHQGHH